MLLQNVCNQGRSPRTRGSQATPALDRFGVRSIPANAGEPLRYGGRGLGVGVDPRERGGASVKMNYSDNPWGRSPRTRGSPEQPDSDQPKDGSIPANAGEPSSPSRRPGTPQVDPRERGGAAATAFAAMDIPGRSPRTRGSQLNPMIEETQPGSIPANAGEPGNVRVLT